MLNLNLLLIDRKAVRTSICRQLTGSSPKVSKSLLAMEWAAAVSVLSPWGKDSESEQIMPKEGSIWSPWIDKLPAPWYEGFRFWADHGNESDDPSIGSDRSPWKFEKKKAAIEFWKIARTTPDSSSYYIFQNSYNTPELILRDKQEKKKA